jgi:starch synthase
MFEPCGQSQIFSMRYGTIPIAFRTGGLIDTITDYPKKSSTGFLFNDFNSISFLEKVDFAIETYNDSSKWSKIVKRAMKSDFSVNQMSINYINLYQKILSN